MNLSLSLSLTAPRFPAGVVEDGLTSEDDLNLTSEGGDDLDGES